VEGLTYENAKAVLEALRFEVERRNVSDPAKPGTVVGQDPPARTRLARGARVTVSVSTGAEKAEVPNVEGMERANARATLEERGFVVREGKEQTADPSLDGVVTKQSPEAGDNAATGSTVTITIGAFTPNP
jgi:serine/threonine-protein kinase